ncbi:MAG: hypothetical protein K0Q91_1009 [Fibrobacteria bacterium]|jgi:hypothetical protein|nr:hypothetical protein [Fibrobacteria bacterium]
MKFLVYSTAFGAPHFFALAAEMFRSLRLRGYSGDALLLCDREPGFEAGLNVRPMVLPDIEGRPLLKARLAEVTDVTCYDRILFVDSDVVFLRDPAPLLMLAADRAMVSRDHYPLERNAFNRSFFTPGTWTPKDLPPFSVNTGVMVFPGSRFAEYAALWLEVRERPEVRARLQALPFGLAELRDQPLLQKLIQEGRWDGGYIPETLLLMPLLFTETGPLHPEAILLHLNGTGSERGKKNALLERMRALNGLETFADFKAACDRLQARRPRYAFPAGPPATLFTKRPMTGGKP